MAFHWKQKSILQEQGLRQTAEAAFQTQFHGCLINVYFFVSGVVKYFIRLFSPLPLYPTICCILICNGNVVSGYIHYHLNL